MKSLFVIFALLFCISNAEEIRFCSIGMGPFGTYTAKLAIEKGFKMVAAFTRYSKHTKTVGELVGKPNDESLQFKVSGMSHLEQLIDETKPHFCIDATNSTFNDVYPHWVRLITKKVHILTLCDSAIYPHSQFQWKSQAIFATVDGLAKKHGVVVLGGGYSDSILIPLIPSMVTAMQTISSIKLTIIANVDDYDSDLSDTYAVGYTMDEFNKEMKDKKETGLVAHWMRTIVEALADSINHPLLELINSNRHKTLQLYTRKECWRVQKKDGLYSKLIDKTIQFGDCKGVNVTVLGKSDNNISIIFSTVAGVMPDIDSLNDVEVKLIGNPDLEFSIKNVDPFVTSAAPLIYRVPMVLNELEPGFHNVGRLKANKYWNKVDDWNLDENDNANTILNIEEQIDDNDNSKADTNKQDL